MDLGFPPWIYILFICPFVLFIVFLYSDVMGQIFTILRRARLKSDMRARDAAVLADAQRRRDPRPTSGRQLPASGRQLPIDYEARRGQTEQEGKRGQVEQEGSVWYETVHARWKSLHVKTWTSETWEAFWKFHNSRIYVGVAIIVLLVGVGGFYLGQRGDYWPTLDDYLKSTGFSDESTIRAFGLHVAIYVASECVDGRKLTAQGFRSSVENTFGGGLPVTRAGSRLAGRRMLDIATIARDRMSQDQSPVTAPCMRPFMYPESGAGAQLVIGLMTAVDLFNSDPLLVQEAPRVNKNTVFRWFDRAMGNNQPLILWVCRTRRC